MLALVGDGDEYFGELCKQALYHKLESGNVAICLDFSRLMDCATGIILCESFILQNKLLANREIAAALGFQVYQQLTCKALTVCLTDLADQSADLSGDHQALCALRKAQFHS